MGVVPFSDTPRNRLPDKDIHIPGHRRIRVFRQPRAFLGEELVQESRQQGRRDRLSLLTVVFVLIFVLALVVHLIAGTISFRDGCGGRRTPLVARVWCCSTAAAG